MECDIEIRNGAQCCTSKEQRDEEGPGREPAMNGAHRSNGRHDRHSADDDEGVEAVAYEDDLQLAYHARCQAVGALG